MKILIFCYSMALVYKDITRLYFSMTTVHSINPGFVPFSIKILFKAKRSLLKSDVWAVCSLLKKIVMDCESYERPIVSMRRFLQQCRDANKPEVNQQDEFEKRIRE